MNRPSRRLRRAVDGFNLKFPVGTAVRLRKDTCTVTTTVRGEAVILGDDAVAWFEGIPGCYSIEGDRVSRATQLAGGAS
jgi:hypothetical protein